MNWKALIAAFVVACIVNLVGGVFFFGPIEKADSLSGPLVPALVGLLLYVFLTITLFDWAARQMLNAYKAAFVIGAAQFLLVNVDYVLAGKRGLLTGAASTLFIIVTWGCVAFVYSYFIERQKLS